MEMFEKLRNLNIDRLSVDEAVFLLTSAKTFAAGYAEIGIPVPEWLGDNIRSLEKDVKSRQRDEMERRLREAKTRRNSLRTAEEKRKDIDEEIARLEAALK